MFERKSYAAATNDSIELGPDNIDISYINNDKDKSLKKTNRVIYKSYKRYIRFCILIFNIICLILSVSTFNTTDIYKYTTNIAKFIMASSLSIIAYTEYTQLQNTIIPIN